MTVKSLDAYRTHRRSLKGARILVVDDEATVRRIIQQFLENAGFTVTVATSGEEALHCLDNDKFDLMLLDIVMPDMVGFKVLEVVRQKYSKSQLLIIMVTIKEESEDLLKAFSLGANDYIVKPVDFTVLRARIDMHLSLQRAENELREARDVLEHRVEERTTELLGTNKALVNEITERKQSESRLKRNQEVSQALVKLQSDIISSTDPHDFFEHLLSILLSVTDSGYGFIGEILHSEKDGPYLKTHAITNIAWNDEVQKFYEENAPTGLEFTNLDTLFGAVIKTGETVIANDAKNDPRSGGLPTGHPALNAFLGVPLYLGKNIIGMAGMANRPDGYDEELAQELEPLLYTCANLIESYRSHEQRQQIAAELYNSQVRLAEAQHIAQIGHFEIDLTDGSIWWSDELYRRYAVNKDEFEPTYKKVKELIHLEDRERVDEAVETIRASGQTCDLE